MLKRMLSMFLVIAMVFGMLPVSASAAGTELSVEENVIDITDKRVATIMDRYYADAVNITVSGADVVNATEDGTTIDVVLADTTDPEVVVTVTF